MTSKESEAPTAAVADTQGTPARRPSASAAQPRHAKGARRRFAKLYLIFRHPRLRTKLLVGVLAGAVLATAVQFGISYRATMGNLHRLETQRMAENLAVAANVVDHHQLDLEQVARDYGSPTVAKHVLARDKAWLQANVLTRLTDLRSVPLVVVLDKQGNPIVSTEWSQLSLLNEQVVGGSQLGVSSSQWASWGNRIWILAASPIVIDDLHNRYVGTILLGRPVDDAFAALVKRSMSASTEIAFTIGSKVVATTNADLTPVVQEARKATSTEGAKGTVVAGGYAAASERLTVPGAESRLVVAVSRAPITAAQRALLRDSAVAALFAIGIGIFIAITLSRQLGRPIATLTDVAKQMAVAATLETQKQLPQTTRGVQRKRKRGGAEPEPEPAAVEPQSLSERQAGSLSETRVRVNVRRRDEVSDLGRAFNDMVEQVELAQETLRRMAVRDGLTGLLNHREFFERLRSEIARADRDDSPTSMLMIDLDLFKKINDTHGHLAGDALLTELARMIEASVRDADVVARYAGDEFAVILPNTGEEQAAAIGERVRSSTAGVPRAAGLPPDETITISVGVVTRKARKRQEGMDERDVRRRAELDARKTVELADTALYRAKHGGRDRVEIQEPSA